MLRFGFQLPLILQMLSLTTGLKCFLKFFLLGLIVKIFVFLFMLCHRISCKDLKNMLCQVNYRVPNMRFLREKLPVTLVLLSLLHMYTFLPHPITTESH